MAHELTPITATRSSLLKPLDERAVLVPNERVYYAERRHWASIVQPIYETFMILLGIVWAVGRCGGEEGATPGVRGIELLLIGAVGHIIFLFATGRRPTSRLAVDPFSNPGQTIGRINMIATAVLAAAVLFLAGPQVLGILAVIVVITRLTVILARWSFYERRYITNRRLIESGGFLGSRISSMPLSRVTDINYMQTIPGELLRYSTMRVETAGQDQALGIVRYIANPDHFYEVLVSFSAPATSPVDEEGAGDIDF